MDVTFRMKFPRRTSGFYFLHMGVIFQREQLSELLVLAMSFVFFLKKKELLLLFWWKLWEELCHACKALAAGPLEHVRAGAEVHDSSLYTVCTCTTPGLPRVDKLGQFGLQLRKLPSRSSASCDRSTDLAAKA